MGWTINLHSEMNSAGCSLCMKLAVNEMLRAVSLKYSSLLHGRHAPCQPSQEPSPVAARQVAVEVLHAVFRPLHHALKHAIPWLVALRQQVQRGNQEQVFHAFVRSKLPQSSKRSETF